MIFAMVEEHQRCCHLKPAISIDKEITGGNGQVEWQAHVFGLQPLLLVKHSQKIQLIDQGQSGHQLFQVTYNQVKISGLEVCYLILVSEGGKIANVELFDLNPIYEGFLILGSACKPDCPPMSTGSLDSYGVRTNTVCHYWHVDNVCYWMQLHLVCHAHLDCIDKECN